MLVICRVMTLQKLSITTQQISLLITLGMTEQSIQKTDGTVEMSIDVWQHYASPVWHDIQQNDILEFKTGREEEDEKHLTPLQLTVIERCVQLWSKPGDVVFSPFLGIGSRGLRRCANGPQIYRY